MPQTVQHPHLGWRRGGNTTREAIDRLRQPAWIATGLHVPEDIASKTRGHALDAHHAVGFELAITGRQQQQGQQHHAEKGQQPESQCHAQPIAHGFLRFEAAILVEMRIPPRSNWIGIRPPSHQRRLFSKSVSSHGFAADTSSPRLVWPPQHLQSDQWVSNRCWAGTRHKLLLWLPPSSTLAAFDWG